MKEKIQRAICITLTGLLLLGMAPSELLPVVRLFANASDYASEVITEGTCGDNLAWTYSDGTLTIIGTGDMKDFVDLADVPWNALRRSIQNILLPDGLTTIGDYAFTYCAIECIMLPPCLRQIGAYAFSDCDSLTEVYVSASVRQYGEQAFSGIGSTDFICRPGSYAYTFDYENYFTSANIRIVSIYDRYPVQMRNSYCNESDKNYAASVCIFDDKDEDKYKGNTYVFYDAKMSWTQAKCVCELLGGHLATVTGTKEMTKLAESLPTNELKGYWLGGFYADSSWQWVTGEAFQNTFWGTDEPNNLNTELWLELYTSTKKWNNTTENPLLDGNATRGFVCEFESNYEPVAITEYNNHLYMAFNESRYWTTLERTNGTGTCQVMGGRLVTITSAAENDVVTRLVEKQYKNAYWMGLTDIVKENKTGKWITGEPFSYSNWSEGEPTKSTNETYGTENYGQLVAKSVSPTKSPGVWNDDFAKFHGTSNFCTERTGFICEIDLASIPAPAAEGYVGTHYYEVYNKQLCYTAAEYIAEKKGGHLLTLNNATEAQGVKALCSAANLSKQNVWLGARRSAWDAAEDYSWKTDEPFTYTAWLSAEPNNAYNHELFVDWDLTRDGWQDVTGIGADTDGTGYALTGDCFVVEYDIRTEPLTIVQADGSAVTIDVPGNTPFSAVDIGLDRTGYTSTLYRDALCQTVWDQNADTITEPMTLYLHQTPNAYTVTLDPTGGTVVASIKTVTYDGKYGLMDTPTREGFDFAGWYSQPIGGERIQAETPMQTAKNHTLYAQWQASEYTVTFDLAGGTVSQDTALTVQVTHGGTYDVFPADVRKSGYTFAGWIWNGRTIAPGDTVTAVQNHTITALWHERSVRDVQLQALPTKLCYTADETFDLSGMLLRITYDNAETQDIAPEQFVVQSWTVGTCTVIVSYIGFDFPVQVTVTKGEPLSAQILTNPTKLTYSVGETLDLTGLTLRVAYAGGVSETVKQGMTSSVTTFNRAGTMRISVYYAGLVCGKITVQVVARELLGISIESPAFKTAYVVGEQLDTKGLTLAVQYTDGYVETISSGYTVQADLMHDGTQTVTLTYTLAGKICTAAYTVYVSQPPRLFANTVLTEAGGEAVVTLMADNLPEHTTGFSLLLRYDERVFTPESVLPGVLTDGENAYLTDSIGASQSGFLKIVFFSAEELERSGELLHLKFRVNAHAFGTQTITWGTCTIEGASGNNALYTENITVRVQSSAAARVEVANAQAMVGEIVEVPVFLCADDVHTLTMEIEAETTKVQVVDITACAGTVSFSGNCVEWSGTNENGAPFITLHLRVRSSGKVPITIHCSGMEDCVFTVSACEKHIARIVSHIERTSDAESNTLVEVTLALRANPGLLGFALTVEYNTSQVQLVENSFAPQLSAYNGMSASNVEDGKLRFVWNGADELTEDVDILCLSFILLKNTDLTTLRISSDPENTFKASGESVALKSAIVSIERTNSMKTIRIFCSDGTFMQQIRWWRKYSTATMKLGYQVLDCDEAVRYVWSSNSDRVHIDQNGTITNTGCFARSARITLTAYDVDGNKVASSRVTVRFYKFNWQVKRLQLNGATSNNIFNSVVAQTESESEMIASLITVFRYLLLGFLY